MSESKMNRRDFLKKAGVGAGVTAGIAAFASPGVAKLAEALGQHVPGFGGGGMEPQTAACSGTDKICDANFTCSNGETRNFTCTGANKKFECGSGFECNATVFHCSQLNGHSVKCSDQNSKYGCPSGTNYNVKS